MKHIGKELKKIVDEQSIKRRDLAYKLDMTEANLSKIYSKESIDAKLLEKICKLMSVPVSFFFDDIPQNGVTGNVVGNKSIAVAGSGNNFFKGDERL